MLTSTPTTRRSFLRHASISFGAASLGYWIPQSAGKVLAEAPGSGAAAFLKNALPRSTPEAEGVSATAILEFLEEVDLLGLELHSFMMLRHGKVIAEGWWEPYGPQFVHTMYSMSKSFTSTAVGFAIAERKLSVEDRVTSFFPDDLPEKISENLAAMQVKHLLTMATGNEKEPTGTVVKEENWVRTFLAQSFSHPPGSVFMYNSAATYMCSAIVQKVTGQTVLDFLTPRLFSPLGITGMQWESCPRGINTGGWGLSIQTEGLAKFGQLLLQKGRWQDQQILPAAWIDEATKFHIQQPGDDKPGRPKAKNDWLQGYGYQFWRCQGTAFRGDGAFGQFTIVVPEQDAVIVMTSDNGNMQGQLDLVWKHLLPACERADLPTADKGEELAGRLGMLKVDLPSGSDRSPIDATGPRRSYTLEANDLGFTRVGFNFEPKLCMITLSTESKGYSIACPFGSYVFTQADIPGTPPRLIAGGKPKTTPNSKIAASAAWTDDKTLVMTWRYYETPHHDTVTCRFEGDEVTVTFLNSITAMNPKTKDARAPLKGKLKA